MPVEALAGLLWNGDKADKKLDAGESSRIRLVYNAWILEGEGCEGVANKWKHERHETQEKKAIVE